MMKTVIAITVCALLAAVVIGDTCHYDCYKIDPTTGQSNKQQLLQNGGVSDYAFSTASSNGGLQSVFKQSPPAGCQLAVCARYPDANAIASYRTGEHAQPQYQVLNGTGVGRYDASCTSCSA